MPRVKFYRYFLSPVENDVQVSVLSACLALHVGLIRLSRGERERERGKEECSRRVKRERKENKKGRGGCVRERNVREYILKGEPALPN